MSNVNLKGMSREELIALSAQVGSALGQTAIKGKRYFAKAAGSRFCFEDGTEIVFYFGRADIESLVHQKELDAILGKQTNIFIPDVPPASTEEVKMNAVAEVDLAQAERGLAGAKVSGDLNLSNTPAGVASDVNQSTLDPKLQQEVMGAAIQDKMIPAGGIVGPGASRLEQVRAAAAANQQIIKPVNPENIGIPGAASSNSGF